MRLKTNIVISIVFAALLAFVYFHEIKGGQERELAAGRARQLVDFSDHEAQKLTIIHRDTTIVLERQDGTWTIEQPLRTVADEEAVHRYLRNLKETEIEGEPLQDSAAVAADPSLLAPYGLDAPRLRVHLGLAESAPASPETLRFGRDAPAQRFTYVQRSGANPEVRTVRAWRFDNLDKGLFDLRDRRVLHFEPEQIQEVRWRHRGVPQEGQIIAQRRAGAWRLVAPLAVAADATVLDDILSRLENARIASFVYESPTPEDLADVGLAEGESVLHLTLLVGESRGEKHLRLGYEQDHGDHYALDTSRDPVFIIDSTVVLQLTKRFEDLRDRKPFRVPADSIVGIDLAVDGQARFSVTRDSAGTWQLASHPQREVKGWRINDLLTDLGNIRVETFVADAADVLDLDVARFGFTAPAVRLVLQRADGEAVFVELVEHEGVTYARRADVASVFGVPAAALDDLRLSLDDVAFAAPAQEDVTQAEADSSAP